MPLTDLLAITAAIALTVIARYAPTLIESRRLRHQIRSTGWADTLEDIHAIAGNKRNGIIATLGKVHHR